MDGKHPVCNVKDERPNGSQDKKNGIYIHILNHILFMYVEIRYPHTSKFFERAME